MSALLARYGWTVAAALLVAVVYGFSLAILPKHVFWMPDEGAKLFELEAVGLSWQDGLTYRIPFAGQRLLPGNEFLPGFDVFPEPRIMADGSLYLEFDSPVAFPLLSAPFFHAYGAAGLYVLPVVSGWLIVLLSGVLAVWVAPGLGPLAVLLVGLGTPVWFYSVVFWEHTLASLLGLIAVALLVRAPRRIESIAAAVPLIMIAGMFRTEIAALGIALFVAWMVVAVNAQLRSGAAMTAMLGVWPFPRAGRWRLLMLSLAATVALGVVLNFALAARHRSILRVLLDRLDQAPVASIANIPQAMIEVFINAENLGPRIGTALVAAATIAVLLGLIAPLVRSVSTQAVMVVVALSMMFVCSASLLVTGEPYRAIHGLFPVAPLAILWPFALRHRWERGDAPLLALGTATWVFMLFIFGAQALTYIHKGQLNVGMQWGQRYLLTAYPMLIILSLVAVRTLLASIPAGLLRSAIVILIALVMSVGIGLGVRGVRMLHGTRGLMAKWDEAMRRAPGPIVTTVWWIVPAVADLFLTREMFFTWRAGLPHWVEVARLHGVTDFTLAHTEPMADWQLGARGIRRVADTQTFTGGLLLTSFQIDPIEPPAMPGGGTEHPP